jgi:hypothetical protein
MTKEKELEKSKIKHEELSKLERTESRQVLYPR